MAKEIEAKFQLKDKKEADKLASTLTKMGYQSKGQRFETNTFFDTPKRKFDKRGEVVRLRTISVVGEDEKYILGFKGKLSPGQFKVREEIELEVKSRLTAEELLSSMGYVQSFCFEKLRRVFAVGSCEVVIDQLPQIGYFCEIEGPDTDNVSYILEMIGYKDAKLIKEGYGGLLRQHAKKKKLSVRVVRF